MKLYHTRIIAQEYGKDAPSYDAMLADKMLAMVARMNIGNG